MPVLPEKQPRQPPGLLACFRFRARSLSRRGDNGGMMHVLKTPGSYVLINSLSLLKISQGSPSGKRVNPAIQGGRIMAGTTGDRYPRTRAFLPQTVVGRAILPSKSTAPLTNQRATFFQMFVSGRSGTAARRQLVPGGMRILGRCKRATACSRLAVGLGVAECCGGPGYRRV